VSSSRAIQILTTEHFTVQAARANTVAETNGRIGIFLGTVSSTLIALAFVGQMSSLGMPFQVFTLMLLPTLVFLGEPSGVGSIASLRAYSVVCSQTGC
jgi:hypothetical protein